MDSTRQNWDVTCAKCGRDTTVPFKPTQDRPVYCRECFLTQDQPAGKLYGTATYYKALKSWEIEAEPHVVIRMKRWFPQIESTNYGKKHRLKATPENCLDLQVFLQRYPMDVRPFDLLVERADKHRERVSLVERFLRGLGNDRKFDLKLPPREYQGLAANMWMTTGGLLLADDVGLGKTCVSFCGFINPEMRPALVVTLSHLPIQWKSELEKFTDLRAHIVKKSTPYDILDRKGRMPDVIIMNYHKLPGWAGTLDGVVKSVVFDECQELRHSGTQKYEAAEQVAHGADYRLGLSATPIYNYGGEIWNVCNIITPDQLGTWEEFSRHWCDYKGNKYVISDAPAFGLYARETGVMLRRTRKEVSRELPGIIRVPQWIESDPEAFKKLKGQAIELAKLILRQHQDHKGQKMQAAGEFDMKMRQATGISKAPFVADFVRFLVEENDTPVVLFGWHREVYEIWLEKLRGAPGRGIPDLNPVMYTGTESPHQKEWAKQEFLSGRSKVMLMSLRAGAGIDGLQEICHVCVFGELDWSPGVHEQDEGRLHRDGQDEPVTAYYLLADQGSDPVVSDVLGVKKQQIEGIRDPNQDLVQKLQVDPEHIKKLAEKYLTDHGIPLPQPVPPEIKDEAL